MPTLQEIMAAKLAAKQAAIPSQAEINNSPHANLGNIPQDYSKEPAPEIDLGETKTAPAIINAEVAVGTSPKVLTFAEKMALKKQQATNATISAPSEVSTSPATVPAGNVETATAVLPIATVDPQVAPTQETNSAQTAAMFGAISSVIESNAAQAYADIERRIEQLVSLSETPLENAMHDLKVALLANPNAVSLMQDTDFGKMVIALRKLVGEEAEAVKEGKEKKTRIKKVNFQNPDEVAAAFEAI